MNTARLDRESHATDNAELASANYERGFQLALARQPLRLDDETARFGYLAGLEFLRISGAACLR